MGVFAIFYGLTNLPWEFLSSFLMSFVLLCLDCKLYCSFLKPNTFDKIQSYELLSSLGYNYLSFSISWVLITCLLPSLGLYSHVFCLCHHFDYNHM
jgi:hypothetical protein